MINQAILRSKFEYIIPREKITGETGKRKTNKKKARKAYTYSSEANYKTLCIDKNDEIDCQSFQVIECKMSNVENIIESSNANSKAIHDINNFIDRKDYPSINHEIKNITASLVNMIVGKYNLEYSRIAPSVEGGIAVVYSSGRMGGVFRRRSYKEVFIEVYNNYSMIGIYSENYNCKEIVEANDVAESENIIKLLEILG